MLSSQSLVSLIHQVTLSTQSSGYYFSGIAQMLNSSFWIRKIRVFKDQSFFSVPKNVFPGSEQHLGMTSQVHDHAYPQKWRFLMA